MSDEDRFLEQERTLLETIAERLARIMESKIAEYVISLTSVMASLLEVAIVTEYPLRFRINDRVLPNRMLSSTIRML